MDNREKVDSSADLLIRGNRLGEVWRVINSDGYQNRTFPWGLYLVSAYDATCYARDGNFSTLDTNHAHRIEAGDQIMWESEAGNDQLTVYASAGGEIRVTPRRTA